MTIKTWQDRLEGLDDGHLTTNSDVTCAMQDEIDELRAALKAQRVQEPVAWRVLESGNRYALYFHKPTADRAGEIQTPRTFAEPLFAAPVQPALLTDEQIKAIVFDTRYKGVIDTARAIEAAMSKKESI